MLCSFINPTRQIFSLNQKCWWSDIFTSRKFSPTIIFLPQNFLPTQKLLLGKNFPWRKFLMSKFFSLIKHFPWQQNFAVRCQKLLGDKNFYWQKTSIYQNFFNRKILLNKKFSCQQIFYQIFFGLNVLNQNFCRP